jgi:hypothetical protein
MGTIRPLAPADLSEIAVLRGRAFRFSEWATRAELEQALHHTFFENPWSNGRSPSLVYERDKRIVGFLGVIPRPFRFRQRRITVAVSTLFMTDPDDRMFAGVELLARFFEGTQDLALADSANDASRLLWTRAGGAVVPGYGMTWTRPLRPFEHTVARTLSGAGLGLGRGLRPLASLLDAIAARRGGEACRRPKLGIGHQATLQEFSQAAEDLVRPYALASEWDGAALEWLVKWIEGRRGLGAVRPVVVRSQGGAVHGCYLYGGDTRAVRTVIQFCARDKEFDAVLDDLFYRVWREGAVAVEGRADGRQVGTFGKRADVALRQGSWVLGHSRNPSLMQALQQGDCYLSRLDGEWWMRF